MLSSRGNNSFFLENIRTFFFNRESETYPAFNQILIV